MPRDVLDRVRALCMALPGAEERPSHGTVTWRTPKRMFAMFCGKASSHSGGRDGIWLFSQAHNQELMIAADPRRFFYPPYVGCHGWIGMWLDRRVSWRDVKTTIAEAHHAATIAKPKKLPASVRRT